MFMELGSTRSVAVARSENGETFWMFEETIAMEKHQRHQYEISNFGLAGHESQHNLMYWNNDHYFGFGAGASGYLDHTRYRNKGPIQHYLRHYVKVSYRY